MYKKLEKILFRQEPLLLLTTTLMVVFIEQSSIAFTITPRQPGATSGYVYSRRYSLRNNQQGITELNAYSRLDPRSILFAGQVTEITRGGTLGLMNALQPFTERGWTFNRAENDLLGRFEIEYYYACGPATACGQEVDRIAQGGVGAFFSLKFYPNITDPQPGQGKLHWIQRVVSNHNSSSNIHGDFEDIIDVGEGHIADPYYDSTTIFAGEDFFIDRPWRPDPGNNHNWFAELYLVEETAPQTVTIYNGVRWGWRNRVSSPPCPRNTTSNNIISNAAIISASYGGEPDFDDPGATQENPLLASNIEDGWQIFEEVPTCRWYDPPTPYGFEFQALDDTLFTEIADFPIGDDDSFTVSVGDIVLGDFSPGDTVDFVSLFGQGISNFTITGIDSPFGETAETAFPIRLGFNNETGSFKMRPFDAPQDDTEPAAVPEPGSVLSLLFLGLLGLTGIGKRQ